MVSASLNHYIFVWDWKKEERVKELIIPDEYYNRNEQDDNTLFINVSIHYFYYAIIYFLINASIIITIYFLLIKCERMYIILIYIKLNIFLHSH